MAAMAQLDCGQCGYLCQTYAEAVWSGAEADMGRCVPGGKETQRKVKELVAALEPMRDGSVVAAPSVRPAFSNSSLVSFSIAVEPQIMPRSMAGSSGGICMLRSYAK